MEGIESDRICAIKIHTEDISIYVVSVYMPHATCSIADFSDVLQKLECLVSDFLSSGEVMIIGDININLGL